MTAGDPIHVGVVLPRGGADGAALREVAIAAEDLGFGSVWAVEHIAVPVQIASRYPFTDDGVPPLQPDTEFFEAMVALGFAAAVTSRVRLGTAVIPLFNRDPVSLAKQAATVDCLSGGRLELGLGAGWLTEEATVLGHPSDKRGKRLDEAIDLLRTAWSEHPVEHHGEFYDIPPVGISPKPIQGADIPIWIGGTSPGALRTTISRATGNILHTHDLAEVERHLRELKQARTDVQVAASVSYEADHALATERARALARLGVDRIHLSTPRSLEHTLEWLTAFASEVLPEFGKRALATDMM